MRAVALALLLVVVAVAVTGCAVYVSMSRQLPDPDLANARGQDQSSVIVDRKGRELVKLYAEENRKDIKLADMPTQLRQAVIATEDKRFYEHEGVDPIGITRALVVDVMKGTKAQGGSTITQQYVKQAFVTSEKTLKRKLQEAILAQKVESKYTKDEILERYLNTIYFGHGAYGVEAASRVYFGKSAKDLTLAECAMIAGVIKSPGNYSPYLEPDNAKARRDTVLKQMKDQGYVDEASYVAAAASQIKLVGLKSRAASAPYFVEWIKEQVIEKYGERRVYRGGLTIKTTLDLKMQRMAQRAVNEALSRDGDPSASVVTLDPATGEVLAMVGGKDFAKQQFNVAVQGKRQPGSAFKPFVLTTALEQDICPERAYESGPVKLQVGSSTWSVTGAHGAAKGPMRLRTATEESVNSVYAQLILEVGADKVVETAEKLGISPGIEAVPAIALGGLKHGVSPMEMARAYATLAAGGMRTKPYGILSVKDPAGKTLFTGKPKTERAIDANVAYLVTDILRGVITRGTGTAAGIGRPAAGKTGTTQQYRDAWFVGYTPELATAVWVGYPDSQQEMTSVHGRAVTGGSFPAQIWHDFMAAALEGRPESNFEKPDGLKHASVCTVSGLAPTPFCPKTIKALVLSSSDLATCTVHATPTKVRVPALVGTPKEDALTALATVKLKVKVVEKVVAGVAAGMVTAQTPVAGNTVNVGTLVTITVSAGGSANEPPVAAFTVPSSIKAGKSAAFDGSTSTDDGSIAKYVWEFGDGTTATGKTVGHIWAAAGTYEVTLWVTDNKGEQASVTRRVTVK